MIKALSVTAIILILNNSNLSASENKKCNLGKYNIKLEYKCLKKPFESDLSKVNQEKLLDYFLELEQPLEQNIIGSYKIEKTLSKHDKREYKDLIKKNIYVNKSFTIDLTNNLNATTRVNIDRGRDGGLHKTTTFKDKKEYFAALDSNSQQYYILILKALIENNDIFFSNELYIDGFVKAVYLDYLITSKKINEFKILQEKISKNNHSNRPIFKELSWIDIICTQNIFDISELFPAISKENLKKELSKQYFNCKNPIQLIKLVGSKYKTIHDFEKDTSIRLLEIIQMHHIRESEFIDKETFKILVNLVVTKPQEENSLLEGYIKNCNYHYIQNLEPLFVEQKKYEKKYNLTEYSYLNGCHSAFLKFKKLYPLDIKKLESKLSPEAEIAFLYNLLRAENIESILHNLINVTNLPQMVINLNNETSFDLGNNILDKFKSVYEGCINENCQFKTENAAKAYKTLYTNIEKTKVEKKRFDELNAIYTQAKISYKKKKAAKNNKQSLSDYLIWGYVSPRPSLKANENYSHIYKLFIQDNKIKTFSRKFDFQVTNIYNISKKANKTGEALIVSGCKWFRLIDNSTEMVNDGCIDSGYLHDLRKSNDYYFASHNKKIIIYNQHLNKISEIENPIPKAAHIIQIKDNRIYALDNIMEPIFVFVVDISNIKKPKIIPHLTLNWYDVNAHLDDQWIYDNKWHVLGSYAHRGGGGKTLKIFDLDSGKNLLSGSFSNNSTFPSRTKIFEKIIGVVSRYPEKLLIAHNEERYYGIKSKFYLTKPEVQNDTIIFTNKINIEMSNEFFTNYPYLINVPEFKKYFENQQKNSKFSTVSDSNYLTFFGSRGIQINSVKTGKLIGFYSYKETDDKMPDLKLETF